MAAAGALSNRNDLKAFFYEPAGIAMTNDSELTPRDPDCASLSHCFWLTVGHRLRHWEVRLRPAAPRHLHPLRRRRPCPLIKRTKARTEDPLPAHACGWLPLGQWD